MFDGGPDPPREGVRCRHRQITLPMLLTFVKAGVAHGRLTERLKSQVVLHGVTEFDLLAYKFRVENGVYEDDTGTPPHESFVTLKRLEHLFETIVIHLPTAGRRRPVWPWRQTDSARRGGLRFGSAVCRV